MPTDFKNFLSDFKPNTKAEWLKKIEKDLKGRSIEELIWKIGPLSIDPFSHADDFAHVPTTISNPQATNSWEIGEDINVENKDFKAANQLALTALMGGSNAPNFIFETYPTENQLITLLKNIELDYVSIHFTEKTWNQNPLPFLKNLRKLALGNGKNASVLRGSIAYDPFADGRHDVKKTSELITWASINLPNFKVITVDSSAYFKDSEKFFDELVGTLLAVNIYCKKLTGNGLDVNILFNSMQFNFEIGTSYFIEIAKLRAFKLLWGNLLAAYNVEPSLPTIKANISIKTQTAAVDTNKVKATTQAMSAVLGGVNVLTIAPSDAVVNKASDFSRRIARNVQHLLQMESYFDRVTDPAAGSYYIEKITADLAEMVWEKFQELAK